MQITGQLSYRDDLHLIVTGYEVLQPLHGETILPLFRTQLADRLLHPLSVYELNYGFGAPHSRVLPHKILYFLLDELEGEVLPIKGLSKGYDLQLTRRALTLEAYFTLLTIPNIKESLGKVELENFARVKTFKFPSVKVPTLNLEHINEIQEMTTSLGVPFDYKLALQTLNHGRKLDLETIFTYFDFTR